MTSPRWLIAVFLAVMFGSAQAFAQNLTVTWDPSTDPAVIGYIVFAGTESGVYTSTFDVGSATSFVYGVVPEQTYFFAVASYAADRVVGPFSAEVSSSAAATVRLTNPGDQISAVGQPASLQLDATDSSGGRVTFSAWGLHQGLALDSDTGRISGAPLEAGTHTIVASASNGSMTSSQTFSWTTTDMTPPVVTITMPTVRTATGEFVTLGGVARDDVAVTAISWVNDRGEGGFATGTDTWTLGVPLYFGRNWITVTAVDAAGNRGTATITIGRLTAQ